MSFIFHQVYQYIFYLYQFFLLPFPLFYNIQIDVNINTFDPEGNLKQVNYALAAVQEGQLSLAIVNQKKAIIACEKKQETSLYEQKQIRKIAEIDEGIYATYSGLTADARKLIQQLRLLCQQHRLTYDEKIPILSLVNEIADQIQQNTQSGGRRPFGVTLLIIGKELDGNYHLYVVEPSGRYEEFYGAVIGKYSQKVREYLEEHYQIDNQDQDIYQLAKDSLNEAVENVEQTTEFLKIE